MVQARSGDGQPQRIGVVSDTHGLLRPQVLDLLRGCDLVLHAGDVGSEAVLDGLAGVAPVVAVRGNVDRGAWADELPERREVDLGGHRVLLLHVVQELREDPAAAGLAAVVSGHTHRPTVEERAGVLWLDPGSAGPRRFRLPVGLATIDVTAGGLTARLHALDVDG